MKQPFLGGNFTSDSRNYEVHRILGMGVDSMMTYVYPRMLAVHDLASYVGVPDPQTGWVPMPAYQPASYVYMQAHGAYLIGMCSKFIQSSTVTK